MHVPALLYIHWDGKLEEYRLYCGQLKLQESLHSWKCICYIHGSSSHSSYPPPLSSLLSFLLLLSPSPFPLSLCLCLSLSLSTLANTTGVGGTADDRSLKRGVAARSVKSLKINLPSVLREVKARDQNAQISGYLLSHATRSRRWKKKWFIVYNLVLYEFEKHEVNIYNDRNNFEQKI